MFVNNPEQVKYSGNLINNLNDHLAQFCVMKTVKEKPVNSEKHKIQDYLRLSGELLYTLISDKLTNPNFFS